MLPAASTASARAASHRNLVQRALLPSFRPFVFVFAETLDHTFDGFQFLAAHEPASPVCIACRFPGFYLRALLHQGVIDALQEMLVVLPTDRAQASARPEFVTVIAAIGLKFVEAFLVFVELTLGTSHFLADPPLLAAGEISQLAHSLQAIATHVSLHLPTVRRHQ